MSDLNVVEATPDDAVLVRDVIHAAFEARLHVDPPSTALDETVDSVREVLDQHGGLLCRVDGVPAGALLFDVDGEALAMRRVSVVPHFQSRGVASALVGVAEEIAASRGYDDMTLRARSELPATLVFWARRGYHQLTAKGPHLVMGKALPVEVVLPEAEDARRLGKALAGLCRGGDVLILTGELGAGKTTLAQGIGAGLGVRGEVTSPSFVISRVHPSTSDGPALVHVDAYRLGDEAELDDLDLDAFVDDAVTVVEWGEGIAEALSDDRLRVHLSRRHGGDQPSDSVNGEADAHDQRVALVTPVGARWIGAHVRSTLAQ
jgi:tRNA threonylcarbamoyladenosine biosynthesis protein TsaE